MAERIRHRGSPTGLTAVIRRVPAGGWAAVVTVVALLAAVVYTVVAAGSPAQVEDHLVALHLDRPGAVTVVYELDKAPLARASCTLVAEDTYHTVIGTLTQVIGPNSRNIRSTVHTAVIRLAHPTDVAVTAFLSGCRITLSHLPGD